MGPNILVVDDEKLIVKGIKFSLEQDKMNVDVAYDGEEALKLINENKYDLIVLDVMLPKISGYELCQTVREFSNTPIIMLTAKSEDLDKIMGLEYGADDYLTKPFNILELKARIKVILRRTNQKSESESSILQLRDIKVDTTERILFRKDEEIDLTSKEFDLLKLFMKNVGKIYSREELLNIIWGFDHTGDGRTVDVHVRRLREKIEDEPSDPKYIHTKWGIGYYFK